MPERVRYPPVVAAWAVRVTRLHAIATSPPFPGQLPAAIRHLATERGNEAATTAITGSTTRRCGCRHEDFPPALLRTPQQYDRRRASDHLLRNLRCSWPGSGGWGEKRRGIGSPALSMGWYVPVSTWTSRHIRQAQGPGVTEHSLTFACMRAVTRTRTDNLSANRLSDNVYYGKCAEAFSKQRSSVPGCLSGRRARSLARPSHGHASQLAATASVLGR